MKNLYWENIKKKNKNKYHFNTKSKKKDFQYIGNIKTNWANIDKLVNKIDLIAKQVHAIQKAPKLASKEVLQRIEAFKEWGYTKNNTKYFQVFAKDHKKIFEKFIRVTGLEMATSSIIKQYPGQTIPWHYDTHIEFYKRIASQRIKKKPIRYMIFLTDWDWGHFFSVGSTIVNKWKKGDIITWDPIMFHTGSNGGISPKVTMNITGFIGNKSIHLNKKAKIYKII
jgi:hypothetical protein